MLTALVDFINILKRRLVVLCVFFKADEESGTAFSCLSVRNNTIASGRNFVDCHI
jgi:hypothetical protein